MFPYRFFALFWSFLATSQDADCPSKKLWKKKKKKKVTRRLNLTPFLESGFSVLMTKIVKATFLREEGSPRAVNKFSFQTSNLFVGLLLVHLGWDWVQKEDKKQLEELKDLETISNLRSLRLWDMEAEKASKLQNYF